MPSNEMQTLSAILQIHRKVVPTSVFQLISSTKPLTTCAAVSAKTLARPTALGSRCIHSSHALHVSSMCGIRCDGSHRLFRYCLEQCAISRRISAHTKSTLLPNIRREATH